MTATPARNRQKLKPGAVVRCRTRRYLVEDVHPPHLRAAATVARKDPIILFTYAQCLLAIEGESHATEADELFQRALQVACLPYVGVQLLLPGQDAGIDFAREYVLAKGMAEAGGNRP